MSENQYERVLDAIHALDDKFTTALATGLAALNAAILALAETHHRAQLEQERRNSTFVTTTQHEALVRRIDEIATGAGSREARLASLEESSRAEASNSFLHSSALTGYLITALISAGAVTLAFLLAHAGAIK